MKPSPKPASVPVPLGTQEHIDYEAARIRAELDADTDTPRVEQPRVRTAPQPRPVIVSCQVSTYIETDPGRGTYSVQLSVEDATITTCITLGHCSAFSLRHAALETAKHIMAEQLTQLRRSMRISTDSYWAAAKPSKAKVAKPKRPKATRDSFWVSEIRTDGEPDFTASANHMAYSLNYSAAFAEFAYRQVD